jgi:hypothetical protein
MLKLAKNAKKEKKVKGQMFILCKGPPESLAASSLT